MHSILLVILAPPPTATDPDKIQDWRMCCTKIGNAAKSSPETEVLAQNVFLIPAKNETHLLGEAIALARDFRQQCKILFFDEPLEWIQT